MCGVEINSDNYGSEGGDIVMAVLGMMMSLVMNEGKTSRVKCGGDGGSNGTE